MRFQVTAIGLACATLLAACGGGGSANDGGAVQAISFPFPGGAPVAIPPDVGTVTLAATASSGGPVTYTSNTPAICTVSGSTLSLLKAGECSVTATQAGFEGYAATSAKQLFVIPKNPQRIVFRNPGPQPLDTTPVPLVATSSVGKTVTFTSSTPAVCSLNGDSMLKLADGMCIVTATQAGDDIYAAQTVTKNIPIGTATSPALTFLSGYKDTSHTKENGAIGGSAGANVNGWWCNGNCTTIVPSDGSSFTFGLDVKLDHPNDGSWIGGYWGMWAFAGGLEDLSKTGDTASGVRIDAQAALKFKLAQNTEWFSTGNNGVNVDLSLGHFVLKDGKDPCNVALRGVVKPSTTAATDYSVTLKNLTVGESCGLTGLDIWNELQDYPVSKINFSPVSLNVSVSSTGLDKPTYPTQLTLTGPITFQ
jgi:hypothetical protein